LLVSFDGDWSRDEALKALGAPDVAWIAWKVDGGLTVEVWPHDVERAVATLRRFLGRDPSWHGVAEPDWRGELSSLDWRVVDVLIDNARAPIGKLSSSTGLRRKTVRTHPGKLIRGQAIYVVRGLGVDKGSGELLDRLV